MRKLNGGPGALEARPGIDGRFDPEQVDGRHDEDADDGAAGFAGESRLMASQGHATRGDGVANRKPRSGNIPLTWAFAMFRQWSG